MAKDRKTLKPMRTTPSKKTLKAKRTAKPKRTVHAIHFEDLDGRTFERLVYAYHVRVETFRSLEWYGQRGKDKGRDIWGVRLIDGHPDGSTVCILCANHFDGLTLKKFKGDIDALLTAPTGKPDEIRVICGGPIRASVRDKCRAYAQEKGIYRCEFWAGVEFEERIRSKAESLLRRFLDGEAFPDDPRDLVQAVSKLKPLDDRERMTQIARIFDRPAFQTPITMESSLPDFKKAVTDTIEALKTGLWRTRDGLLIDRIPTKHDLSDRALSRGLAEVEAGLVRLRATYDELVRQKEIGPCGCADVRCPVFLVSPSGAQRLTEARNAVLRRFAQVYPDFEVHPGAYC
ncbi:MAG: hypothetical protein L6R00_02640 [Phycisphaerae bacterium]|nr:hypothetical protein [Phycisphaerae bacterium]